MNCEIVREELDQSFDSAVSAAVRDHLRECPDCGAFRRDLETIRTALASPVRLSEHSQRTLWRRLDRKLHRSWAEAVSDLWSDARARVRDLDRLALWSRLASIPMTALAILVLFGMFPGTAVEEWRFTVLAAHSRTGGRQTEEQAVTVQVSQPRGQLKELLDTAWKIPYEDSLWLTADIRSDGKAEIGDVFEYPKNLDLLEAVDQTLRHSKFELAENLVDPVVVYSFQKVDVYETQVF